MLDEGDAFNARLVTEPVRRCITVVDDHEALKAAAMRRDLLDSLDRGLGERAAAGNPHRMSADGAAHALTGRFADLSHLLERNARGRDRSQDSMTKWVLRVALQTCNQAEDVSRVGARR